MNLRQAIDRFNVLTQRKGILDGSGGFSSNGVKGLITDANNWLYNLAVDFGPTVFSRKKRFTYEASQESVNIESKLGYTLGWMFFLGTLAENADASPANMPCRVEMPVHTMLDTQGSRAIQGSVIIDGVNYGSIAPKVSATPLQAFLLGEELLLRPIPEEDTYLWVRGVPEILPDLVEDDDVLLGGTMKRFHEAVVVRAAMVALATKQEDQSKMESLLASIIGRLDGALKYDILKRAVRNKQRQQPEQMGRFPGE